MIQSTHMNMQHALEKHTSCVHYWSFFTAMLGTFSRIPSVSAAEDKNAYYER
jgi:hypothetical protein